MGNKNFHPTSSAFESRLAVGILRVPGGLDYSAVGGDEASSSLTAASSSGDLRVRAPIMHADSDLDIRADHPKNNLSKYYCYYLRKDVFGF